MPHYRCLFVDHAGHVFAGEEFEGSSDVQAIARAGRLYTPHIGKGLELWRGSECLFLRDDKHVGPPPSGHRDPGVLPNAKRS